MNKIVEVTYLEERLKELEAKLLAMGIKGDDGADGKDGAKGDRGLRGLKGKDAVLSIEQDVFPFTAPTGVGVAPGKFTGRNTGKWQLAGYEVFIDDRNGWSISEDYGGKGGSQSFAVALKKSGDLYFSEIGASMRGQPGMLIVKWKAK